MFTIIISVLLIHPFQPLPFQIYHPNVDKLGRICLDVLKDKWSPALQIRTVLLSIQALLSAPNPDDPLDNNVAEHWKRNEADAINTGAYTFVGHPMERNLILNS